MRIGIVGNRRYAPLVDLLKRLAAEAPALGVQLVFEPQLAGLLEDAVSAPHESADLDFLLSLGGDGTFLRGARVACVRDVPILGINLGHVGFLAGAGPDMATAAMGRICRGQYTVERRNVLSVRVGDEGAPLLAVNDAVIHKGGVARVIRMAVLVDGEQVGTYSADGIIVATPTGSTAYSMSAGGPIVVPSVDAFIVTPICPHTLAVRPLVVPSSATIMIRVLDPVPRPEELLVSLDGQASSHLAIRQGVNVLKAKQTVQLAQIDNESFFRRLSRKMAWGDLSDRQV